MRRATRLALSALLVVACVGDARAGAGDAEAAYVAELQTVAPAAVPAFEEANEARDSGEYARALELYSQVHALAPAFSPATRRVALTKLTLGQTEGVIESLRKLLQDDPSPDDELALANALVGMGTREGVSPGAKTESRAHLEAAFAKAPDEPYVWQGACDIALRTSDGDLLQRCSSRLDSLAPEAESTWIFRMYECAAKGDRFGAGAALEGAHARGMPDATYQTMRADFERARWQTVLAVLAGAFSVALVLVFLLVRWRSRRAATSPEPAAPARAASSSPPPRRLS